METVEAKAGRHFSAKPHDLLMPFMGRWAMLEASFMHGDGTMANEAVKIEGAWRILRIAGWIFVGVLLVLPAIAMQFTSEVNWSASDFIVMGALLGSIGLATEFLVRRSANTAYRAGVVIATATAFLTIWVNLAVGMIGDDNPYNLLFGAVVGIALVGSIISNFKAAGMARTMFAAAAAQAVIGGFGIVTDFRGGILSMMFALPWILSAALFSRAATDQGTSTVSAGSGSVSG
jgi:hypothetical protein